MKSGDYIMCSDYNVWKEVMREELLSASSFDIHCWNEEIESIQLALKYGVKKPFDWNFGQVITGLVTPKFIEFIIGIQKLKDTELSKIMTPFFSIFLNTGFSSEHYGSELIKR